MTKFGHSASRLTANATTDPSDGMTSILPTTEAALPRLSGLPSWSVRTCLGDARSTNSSFRNELVPLLRSAPLSFVRNGQLARTRSRFGSKVKG
jgi:hypothetical protein